MWAAWAMLLAGFVLGACAPEDPPDAASARDAGPPPVYARFELADHMALGDVPWPDDAYLDEEGHVSVRELTPSAGSYVTQITDALDTLDGFSVRPTAFVAFDDAIDPASLPDSSADSLANEASVFLVDADTSSPTAYQRVAIDVVLAADGTELRARPAYGYALAPGRRYAFVVTSALRAASGGAVEASPRFARITDPSARLTSRLERRAADRYAPVLQTLHESGVRRERVVALAVFRTLTAMPELAEAREIVTSRAAVPRVTEVVIGEELDARLGHRDEPGIEDGKGVAHGHLAALVQLSLRVPRFIPGGESPRGGFERTREGALAVSGTVDVPCSLLVPLSRTADRALPVALVQHGLFGERSDALPVGNALASIGYAVMACDAPFHGMRVAEADVENRFTGEPEPDGFGDRASTLLPSRDEPPAADPRAVADAVRQGSVELFALVHALSTSAFDGPLAATESLAGVALAPHELAFVGMDVGAGTGLALMAHEPAIGAAALASGGGIGGDAWLQSAELDVWAQAVLSELGIAELPREQAAFEPAFEAVRMLLDRATAFAYARDVRRSTASLLMWMAARDEWVPNAQTEALAAALGARLVGAMPRFVPDLQTDISLPGSAIRGNLVVQGRDVTRVLQYLDPATHRVLVRQQDFTRFALPLDPPFTLRERPLAVQSPTQAVLDQMLFFFASQRACRALTDDPVCAASVSRLSTR